MYRIYNIITFIFRLKFTDILVPFLIYCNICKIYTSILTDFFLLIFWTVPSWDISRSNEEQKRLLESTETTNQKGYIRPDLLPFISYRNIIPDELHLRMRITNKLLNQVKHFCSQKSGQMPDAENDMHKDQIKNILTCKAPFHFINNNDLNKV